MNATAAIKWNKKLNHVLINISVLLLVYSIPGLSHQTGLPIYLIEPMRIFIVLSLLHSDKINSYMLGLSLPIFSFAISSHPVFFKAGLISIELIINVFLFYHFSSKKLPIFAAIFLSILCSKFIYYLFKFIFIQNLWIEGELFSTPVYIQLITSLILAIYGFIAFTFIKKKE